MGEASKRDEATTSAVNFLSKQKAEQAPDAPLALRLSAGQVAVSTALQRCCQMLALERIQLEQIWGQGAAAKEFASACEYLTKYGARFLADCARSVQIAQPGDIPGLIVP